MDPEIQRSLIPAVFGLVGVLVGGFITAGMEWWKLGRAEKKDEAKELAAFHKGARILSGELETVMAMLSVCRETRTSAILTAWSFDSGAWRTYRHVLAAHLELARWGSVREAFTVLAILSSRAQMLAAKNPLSDDSLEAMNAWANVVGQGRKALALWVQVPDAAQVYLPPEP